MTWVEIMVAELARRKRAGERFATAWTAALELHPPKLRDTDRREPAADLFAAAGFTLADPHPDPDEDRADLMRSADWSLDPDDGEPFLEAFRRYAYDAWHGFRPALAHFRILTEGGELHLGEDPLHIAA